MSFHVDLGIIDSRYKPHAPDNIAGQRRQEEFNREHAEGRVSRQNGVKGVVGSPLPLLHLPLKRAYLEKLRNFGDRLD